jgi:beta-glucosidase
VRGTRPGLGTPWGTPTTIRYEEGSEVGYRWFARRHTRPLYPFGHGLSYTSFDYSDLQVSGGDTVTRSRWHAAPTTPCSLPRRR